ncbi:hypothetical protein V5O48_010158 [Marasmius crinis-equi]|uniref:Uncharacterized protein n=1 Tax=Marasmius crinis-equi TaxID=585013 RepID=A0ABR3F936_9AGAR
MLKSDFQLNPPARSKVVVGSSARATKKSPAALPFLLKLLYAILPTPHNDKLGLERLAHYSAGWSCNERDVDFEALSPDWGKNLPMPGFGALKDVMLARPALLADGGCVADSGGKPYRVGGDDPGGWTVLRRGVAHLIVDAVMNRWGGVR